MIIKNLNDFAAYFGRTSRDIENYLYENTSCTEFLYSVTDIKIGFHLLDEVEYIGRFRFPFDSSAIDKWLRTIDAIKENM